jgi:hypothetical protein
MKQTHLITLMSALLLTVGPITLAQAAMPDVEAECRAEANADEIAPDQIAAYVATCMEDKSASAPSDVNEEGQMASSEMNTTDAGEQDAAR